jgi:hypothetical protein
MISWYWLIVAFCAGVALSVFCNEYFDGGFSVITEILSGIALVLLFVPIVFYNIFLKNTIHPVEPATFERIVKMEKSSSKSWKIAGRLYLCFDRSARHIWNKVFFVLLKKNT